MEILLNRMNPFFEPPTILKRVAAGDESAVRDCVAFYGNSIWTMAKQIFGATEQAENAVLEIFTDIWKAAERFDAAQCSEAEFIGLIIRRRLVYQRKSAPEDNGMKPEGAFSARL